MVKVLTLQSQTLLLDDKTSAHKSLRCPTYGNRPQDPDLSQLYLLEELCQEERVISQAWLRQSITHKATWMYFLIENYSNPTIHHCSTPTTDSALSPTKKAPILRLQTPVLPKTAGLPRGTSVCAAGHSTGSLPAPFFLVLSAFPFFLLQTIHWVIAW